MFRNQAERVLPVALRKTNRNEKSNVINNEIKQLTNTIIKKLKMTAKQEKWSNDILLNEILLVTYASYIVMLEYRNKVWPYEYMAFARRVGELWEPFCKLTFEYSVKELTLIVPPNFEAV